MYSSGWPGSNSALRVPYLCSPYAHQSPSHHCTAPSTACSVRPHFTHCLKSRLSGTDQPVRDTVPGNCKALIVASCGLSCVVAAVSVLDGFEVAMMGPHRVGD